MSLRPGDRLDRYEILDELGQGGMSIVYRARDTQLQRVVAIKVLHAFLANNQAARQRFHREAVAVARLRHPAIVEIFDYSGQDAELLYIVCEAIDGMSLASFVAATVGDKAPWDPPELALVLLRPVLDALGCAHREGVIHRDVKPENVLVSRTGAVKLADFGVAWLRDNGELTATGTLLGSPAYLAPESIEGQVADSRTDIFAFGAMLYRLVTGTTPFTAESMPALLKEILAGTPTPVHALNRNVHPALARIIHRCIAKDPSARYQSAQEVDAASVAFLRDLGLHEERWVQQIVTLPQQNNTLVKRGLEKTYEALGDGALAQGRVGDAVDHFDRVLSLNPQNVRVRESLRRVSRRRDFVASGKRVLRVTGGCFAAVLIMAAVWMAGESFIAPHFKGEKRNVVVDISGRGRLEIDGLVVAPMVEDLLITLELPAGEHRFRLVGDTRADEYTVTIPKDGPFEPIQLDVSSDGGGAAP